ncbi:MAG: tRNA pseudouridine(13) synthase TruD [Candidatus Micrarchaeota archaeon]|nr:tRNA pseudouridine(13) synthase TruD [Candidatus Micrarchaeota archaeon]
MLTLSSGAKLKGTVKSEPGDFVVEEIADNGTVLEIGKRYSSEDLGLKSSDNGNFSVFVMQKSNWNTIQALRAVSKKLMKGVRSAGFAGTKDRISISTQLCSIFGATPEQLQSIHIKDIAINGAWRSDSGITMGQLLGNRFTINVRNVSGNADIGAINEELNGIFPNYFGEQRFGFRDNNVKIGIAMLRGDFKEAIMEFLTGTGNESKPEATAARRDLSETQDFKEALKSFPTYLKYERIMLEYLSKYPSNYANAMRTLPRQLSLMFIHAVESQIFNRELEERVKGKEVNPSEGDLACPRNSYSFPDLNNVKRFRHEDSSDQLLMVGNIVGYETKHSTDTEERIMDEMDITTDSFKINGLKELSCRGTYRALFAPYKGFSYAKQEDGRIKLSFSLPSGSYATILSSEFVESNKSIQ